METFKPPNAMYYEIVPDNEWDYDTPAHLDWIRTLDSRYLRPVGPSPDVEAAAKEHAHQHGFIVAPHGTWELAYKAFLSGHTLAMMSKPQVNASMDFMEMFTGLFDTSFLTPDELETTIKAAEMYALAKCREAEDEILKAIDDAVFVLSYTQDEDSKKVKQALQIIQTKYEKK